eukprot:2992213-Rhodomonas_salina.4
MCPGVPPLSLRLSVCCLCRVEARMPCPFVSSPPAPETSKTQHGRLAGGLSETGHCCDVYYTLSRSKIFTHNLRLYDSSHVGCRLRSVQAGVGPSPHCGSSG